MKGSRRHVAEASARALAQIAPPGWVAAQLGDVAELQPGYAFDSDWFASSGVRLLRGTNIVPGGTRWEDVVHLPLSLVEKFAPYALNAGDIVIAMDRPFISTGLKVARLAATDCPALLLQRVGRFHPSAAISPEFLYYYLQGTTFSTHTGSLATGTQLPHISKTDIETCPMLVPPVNEQRRIVAKLDALFEKTRAAKARLERLPALLDKLRRSILAAAFRGDLTADWRAAHPNVEPASALARRGQNELAQRAITRGGGRNVETVMSIEGQCALSVNKSSAELPAGWSSIALRDIAQLESGHTPSRGVPGYWDGPFAWIGIKDARDHHARTVTSTEQTITQAGLDNSAARLLPANTVCLSRTASVGYVVLMGSAMATSQDFANWVCTEVLEPRYLMYALLAEGEDGLRLFGKGTTHTTIYFPELKALHLRLAPLDEQREIVRRLDAAFAALAPLAQRIAQLPERLATMERAFLAKAFRGEIVEQDSTDEPAAALLDRIRADAPARSGPMRTESPNATRRTRSSHTTTARATNSTRPTTRRS